MASGIIDSIPARETGVGGGIQSRLRARQGVDALIASDPGLNRLRMGAFGATSVAAALGVEFVVSKLVGADAKGTIVFMLLGSVVGMLGSNALAGHDVWKNVRSAMFFPVAFGAGLFLAVLTGGSRVLSLVGFIVVMFIAVYVRRFGLTFFFYGFMMWMGYFFADFLQAEVADLPMMILAIVVGTALVLLLSVSIFRPDPRRTLARVFRSMNARSRELGRICAALLTANSESERQRAARHMFTVRSRINDTALMSDGWAAHSPALPVGWSAAGLRRRLLDMQLSLDRIASASEKLSTASSETRMSAAAALTAFANGDAAAARHSCEKLLIPARATSDIQPQTQPDCQHQSPSQDQPQPGARQLATGIAELTALPAQPLLSDSLEPNADFVPAAELKLGQLPGSGSIAKDVTARGGRWNPLTRLSFTTRQAVQVTVAGAIAIVVGTAISDQRYYWAVIAAFVAFTGTGTRAETFRKSFNRVLGTLIGLFAGIGLANLTTGHLAWAFVVIVMSIFCGFYLVRVSYVYMIFFITIMVSQLYGILGEFSDELLLVRLEETAAGAAVGVLVALVVAPISTRDTIAHTERSVLRAIADLMDAAARRLRDPDDISSIELDRLMLSADNAMRQLTLIADPLTRYSLWESRSRALRRRLTLLASSITPARAAIASIRPVLNAQPPLAAAFEDIAALARHREKNAATDGESDVSSSTHPADETSESDVAQHEYASTYRALARLHDLLAAWRAA